MSGRKRGIFVEKVSFGQLMILRVPGKVMHEI